MSNSRLTTEEELLLTKIVKHITAGVKNPEHTQKVLSALDNKNTFNLDRFAKFTRRNAVMRDFCMNNPEAKQIIANALAHALCPNIEVISKDLKEQHSLYDHLQSYTRLLDYHQIPRSANSSDEKNNREEKATIWKELDDRGAFYYLLLSCNNTLKSLLQIDATKDPIKSDNLIKELELFTDRLANLYAGPGYVIKGVMMAELEVLFDDKHQNVPAKKSEYENKKITNLLCAANLAEEKDYYSCTLMQTLTNNRGPNTFFKDNANLGSFNNLSDLKNAYKELLGDTKFNEYMTAVSKLIAPDKARTQVMLSKMTSSQKSDHAQANKFSI